MKITNEEEKSIRKIIVDASRVFDKPSEISMKTRLIADANLDSLSFINVAVAIETILNIDLRMDASIFEKDITLEELLVKLESLKK